MTPKDVLQDQLKGCITYFNDFLRLLHGGLFDYQPNPDSRTMGEVLLHIIRSLEYYLVGVTANRWEVLDYTTASFDSLAKIKQLVERLKPRLVAMVDGLTSETLYTRFDHLEQPAFGLNLLIELLYHHLEHIGQLSIYARNCDVTPPAYPFLV